MHEDRNKHASTAAVSPRVSKELELSPSLCRPNALESCTRLEAQCTGERQIVSKVELVRVPTGSGAFRHEASQQGWG